MITKELIESIVEAGRMAPSAKNRPPGIAFSEIDADHRITEICDTLSIGASIENIAYPELTAYLKTKDPLVGAVAMGYADEAPMPGPRKALTDILEFRP